MRADELKRRRLDLVFGLLLASGLSVGVLCLLALGNWIKPQGEAAFGLYIFGIFTFVPSSLAWLAGCLHAFMAPRDRDVRLGAALTTGHLGWWLLVISLAMWGDHPLPGWVMRIVLVEPGVYSLGATYLAARWFWRRRPSLGQVAA
jgi:Kef-type K+ transport system membrane component KefB